MVCINHDGTPQTPETIERGPLPSTPCPRCEAATLDGKTCERCVYHLLDSRVFGNSKRCGTYGFGNMGRTS